MSRLISVAARQIAMPRQTHQIMQWLSPPVFPDDPEKTRRAALLNGALVTLLALLPMMIIGNLLGGRTPPVVYGLDLFMVATCLLLRIQMRRGHVAQASGWLIFLGIVVITSVLARLGTVRAPAAAVYLLLIISAALLTNLPTMIGTVVACTLAVAGLISAGNNGLLPVPDLAVGVTQGVTFVAVFAWTGALMYVAIRALRKAVNDAEVELARRNEAEVQLARHLAQLEETVRHRTSELTLANGRLKTEMEELERTKEALRESEKKFATAFRSSPDTIILTRLSDGVIVEANEGFSHMSGFDRDEVVGHNTHSLKLWFDDAERNSATSALGKSGIVRSLEFRFRRKTGEVFTGLFSASVVALSGQAHVLSTIQDITARKNLEQEREALIAQLRESLATVKSLSGVIPICMHCKQIRDDKGYWNRLEEFIRNHTEAEFSHGICPSCEAKYFP